MREITFIFSFNPQNGNTRVMANDGDHHACVEVDDRDRMMKPNGEWVEEAKADLVALIIRERKAAKR